MAWVEFPLEVEAEVDEKLEQFKQSLLAVVLRLSLSLSALPSPYTSSSSIDYYNS